MVEQVVLVDEENAVQGTAAKHSVHDDETPLHRGMSIYLFNDDGDLLLQQRSDAKKTWPSYWSNSCCGHPALEETILEAARRRCDEELGVKLTRLTVALPEYRYRFELDGVVENELCPVLVAQPKTDFDINPDEVQAVRWASWSDVKEFDDEDTYTPWFLDEIDELAESDQFMSWYDEVIE